VLSRAKLGPYVDEHLATVARLHREDLYDRMTATVEETTGRPAESVEEFVTRHSRNLAPRTAVLMSTSVGLLLTSVHQRSDLNAARISLLNSSGSSQAAKWPPLSTSLK
jgi:hypothetical protein